MLKVCFDRRSHFWSTQKKIFLLINNPDEPPKWSHFFFFCARASAKVCRIIFPKLKGSDFELSHTIFKC